MVLKYTLYYIHFFRVVNTFFHFLLFCSIFYIIWIISICFYILKFDFPRFFGQKFRKNCQKSISVCVQLSLCCVHSAQFVRPKSIPLKNIGLCDKNNPFPF